MVLPLLAPMIGNLAASMLPSLGTSVAGAIGAAGSAGPLVAAAAPKAIGAGIGSLLAGAPVADAATNALGFGARAAAGMMGGGGAPNTVVASGGPAPTAGQQIAQMMGGQPQQPAPGPLPANPGATGQGAAMPGQMASMPQPAAPVQVPQQGPASMPSPYRMPGADPMSAGIGSLPGMGGQPMPSVSQMIGSLGPNAPAAQQYLMGQRGFS